MGEHLRNFSLRSCLFSQRINFPKLLQFHINRTLLSTSIFISLVNLPFTIQLLVQGRNIFPISVTCYEFTRTPQVPVPVSSDLKIKMMDSRFYYWYRPFLWITTGIIIDIESHNTTGIPVPAKVRYIAATRIL